MQGLESPKMKNKELIIRFVCVFIGIAVGVVATVGCWYYKEIYKYNIMPVSKSDISKFNTDEFWDKTTYYYENDLGVFLNNYYSIYNTYSLYDSLETSLNPYYEEFGYDVILISGLKSSSKMANIYCIEKCCDIIGDKRVNKKAIKDALNEVIIDDAIITDYEDEKEYISLAKERLALAKSLFDQNYNASGISKSENNKRYAWVSNVFYNNIKIRVIDNGFYYTLDRNIDSIPKKMEFVTNNIIQLKFDVYDDEYIKTVSFSEKITLFDIQDFLRSYIEKQKDRDDEYGCEITISDVKYDDFLINGNCNVYDYNTGETEEYNFAIDTSQCKVVEFNIKN